MSDLSRKQGVTADDDRNLVLVDGDFQEADLDDKIWLFWERNRPLLVGGAVLLFLAGLGFLGYRAVRQYRADAVGADYAQAVTPEMKVAFAERHVGRPLAALAVLEAADAAYAGGDYAGAAKRYAQAVDYAAAAGAPAAIVDARAPVAAGLAEIRAGRTEEGLKRLRAVADDTLAPKAAKLHALYSLAEYACGEKDFAKARTLLDRFDREATGNPAWTRSDSPKSLLVRAFPELTAAAPAPAAK